VGAAMLTRPLDNLLFAVSATDAPTLLAAIATLLVAHLARVCATRTSHYQDPAVVLNTSSASRDRT
jgi:hypothetical protein